MANTPLIKQINSQSLITFPTALEDFEVNALSNGSSKIEFTNYALLNLPDITSSIDRKNNIDFERIEGVFTRGLNSEAGVVGDRLDLSESLQNYLLNFESILSEQSFYDKSILKNPNEKIFWKWLKEIGAIRFKNSDVGETLNNVIRFEEELDNEDPENPLYSRVVKQIGRIGLQNQVKGRKNSFSEIYLLIPTVSGNTPRIHFSSEEDINYFPRMVIKKENDVEFINGFNSLSDTPTTGLDIIALYDRDVSGIPYSSTDDEGNPISNWFDYALDTNSYLTEEEFGSASNDTILRDNGNGTNKEIFRNKLDGISLDFNFNNYRASQTGISTFEEYNRGIRSQSFEYNAIALYYTVTDVVTGESATNLYGIAFLGDLEEFSPGSSRISRTTKIKNDSLLGNGGNAYGYRFNFKLSVREESVNPKIETDVNPEANFGMQMFGEVLSRYQEVLRNYEKTINDNVTLTDRLQAIENQLENYNVDGIEEQISSLSELIEEININDVNNQLIQNLNNSIEQILSGRTNITVDLAFEPIGRNGIKSNYDSENGILTIENNRTSHSEVEKLQLDVNINNINTTRIGSFNKLIVLESINSLGEPINLRLDDKGGWKSGQTVKIFGSRTLLSSSSITVKTDNNGVIDSNPYNLILYSGELKQGSSILITCINSTNLEFIIE